VYRDKKPEVPFADTPHKTVAETLGIKAEKAIKHEKKVHTHDITIKVAGFGGQGVLLLGQLIAEMGMREHMEVSWLPSYGPEMRSGSAHCHVSLSHERIGSPLITHPQVLIAMNELSLRKFAEQVAPGGVIIYNRDKLPADLVIDHARVICLPASEIADVIGSAKVANVVMLGALLEETECLPAETAMAVLQDTVKNAAILELDRKALQAGREYVDNTVRVGPVSGPDGFAY
jgi:2-oxoisovalerate ferredoxin oxidoreductase beta subunit